MGTDDFFKKKRAQKQKRRAGYRQPKTNSFLIVTEGTRTEPFYLKGLRSRIEEKIGGHIDICEVPKIDIVGQGCATMTLVDKTEELVNRSKILYQQIWIVFDKDDFRDFDAAIREGERKGFHMAWSNQSFEYWLYLHFCYSDAALHREQWHKKLSEIFSNCKIGDGQYHKNDENVYTYLSIGGGVERAIRNAKKRMEGFRVKRDKPSQYDPGTKMHELVEALIKFLK